MINVPVALLPVLLFLAVLIFMDSFKLVPLRAVVQSILVGCVAAVAAGVLNGRLMDAYAIPTSTFSRYVAPVTEELLKALYVVYLVNRKRVGFSVDAAIHGFAIGAGFALVENVDYLRALRDEPIFFWIVRGFGTALLHGATTSILAIVSKGLADHHPGASLLVFVPAFAGVVTIHSAYNHFILPALAATAIMLIVLPLLVIVVFEQSEKGTREWLGVGLDTDLDLLGLILSGEVAETRIGSYLLSLRSTFEGIVVADMLCLLRIHLELSIRAKGLLLGREMGIEVPVGDDVKANLEEMRYLERAIGKTGLLALKPIRRRNSSELWQIYMLQQARS